MAQIAILPYPAQLPQDYYTKGLPAASPPPPDTPPITPLPSTPAPIVVNNGGVYYGDIPPDSPSYGWLWTNTQGALYVYMEPGVWSQIGTNW
jgi:hypothetical protein